MNGRLLINVFALSLLALGGCTTVEFSDGLKAVQNVSPYEKGKQAYLAGNYGLAIKFFRVSLNQHPDSVDSMNGLAAAYDMLGRYDLSYRLYRSALRYHPGAAETLNNLGYSHLLQNKPDVAYSFLREALSSGHSYPEILANINMARQGLVRPEMVITVDQPTAPEPQPRVTDTPAPGGRVESKSRLRIVRSAPGESTLIMFPPDIGVRKAPLASQVVQGSQNHSNRIPNREQEDLLTMNRGNKDLISPHRQGLSENYEDARNEEIKWILGVRTSDENEVRIVNSLTMEISNGTGRRRMAARMRGYLEGRTSHWGAIAKFQLSNADSFTKHVTTLFFKPGTRSEAIALAKILPGSIRLVSRMEQRTQLHLELGADFLGFDLKLISAKESRGRNA